MTVEENGDSQAQKPYLCILLFLFDSQNNPKSGQVPYGKSQLQSKRGAEVGTKNNRLSH